LAQQHKLYNNVESDLLFIRNTSADKSINAWLS